MNQLQFRNDLKNKQEYYSSKVHACVYDFKNRKYYAHPDKVQAEKWRVKRRVIDRLLKTMPKKKELTEGEKKQMRAYYHANKEQRCEYSKAYRKENAEYYKARNKERVICGVCGKNVNKKQLRRHQRGKKCMAVLCQ